MLASGLLNKPSPTRMIVKINAPAMILNLISHSPFCSRGGRSRDTLVAIMTTPSMITATILNQKNILSPKKKPLPFGAGVGTGAVGEPCRSPVKAAAGAR